MKWIVDFRRRNCLQIDSGIVIVSSIAFCSWLFFFNGLSRTNQFLEGNRSNLYLATATIAGSLLGFSITATSIALGFSFSDRLYLLRRSAHYTTIWKVFLQNTSFLGTLTVLALICLLFDTDREPTSWLIVPFTLSLGFSIVGMWRTTWILKKMIQLVIEPVGNQD